MRKDGWKKDGEEEDEEEEEEEEEEREKRGETCKKGWMGFKGQLCFDISDRSDLKVHPTSLLYYGKR